MSLAHLHKNHNNPCGNKTSILVIAYIAVITGLCLGSCGSSSTSESFMATSVAATLQSNENALTEKASATPTVQPTESQEATPEYLSIPDKSWNENVKAYMKQVWGRVLGEDFDQHRKNEGDFVSEVFTKMGGMSYSLSSPGRYGQDFCEQNKDKSYIFDEISNTRILEEIINTLDILGRDYVVFVHMEGSETCYYEKEGLVFVIYYDFEDKPFRADAYVGTIPTSLDPKIQKALLDGNMLVKVHQDGNVEGTCKGELFSYQAEK